tara:strand:- start:3660 stop:4127 length:468 start_codon:yes stop_codon:yes gene_type:complete
MTSQTFLVSCLVVFTSLRFSNSAVAQQFQTVRTTAYTHSEADHLKYGRKTASGSVLRFSREYSSAAADWSQFPLGTKFRIKGQPTIYVIDDYGSALVGTRTIDIYQPTTRAMNTWGVQIVEIEILEDGCFRKSKALLSGRLQFAHCRQMFDNIDG